MAHVSGPEAAIDRLGAGGDAVGPQPVAKQLEQCGQRGAVANRHVVDLAVPLAVVAGGGEQVGLHGVRDVAEIAAGFSVAVDVDGLVP